MRHALVPIPCKPWMLNGLSERLIVSHYENDYGGAVRSLNAIREELGSCDIERVSEYRLRALKREELGALGSVALHELYFHTLGGDGGARFTGSGLGTDVGRTVAAALEQHFGSVAGWQRKFVRLAGTLSSGSGWVMLVYSRRDARLTNQITVHHAEAMVDAAPLVVLDMYEHAYHIDFGANAAAYIDAFMRNIDWNAVAGRLAEASGAGPPPSEVAGGGESVPSVSVEELMTAFRTGAPVQVLDARPKHYFSRTSDMMQGAHWHDPDRIDEWSAELSVAAPVVVYCAYGYGVGRGVTTELRERGFDAKYVRGGLSAWYAAGGERVLKPQY